MKRIENIAAALFGLMFLVLAFAVAVETVLRKVFNRSLQGVDELGGYILACGAALAFAVALVGRAHIRIDIVHDHLPRFLRIVLNVLAMAALTVTAAVVLAMGWISLSDSRLFNATAQTPWATELRYPQTAWVLALAVFLIACLAETVRMIFVAVREGGTGVDRQFGPRTSREELQEEIEDLRARGGLAIEPLPGGKQP